MREVFPFQDDRDVIRAFLLGNSHPKASTYLENTPKTLSLAGSGAVLFYDTGGSLCASLRALTSPAGYLFTARAINYATTLLGMPERKLECQPEALPLDGAPRVFKWFLEGEEINVGSPMVICGPMSVQAFRVTERRRKP